MTGRHDQEPSVPADRASADCRCGGGQRRALWGGAAVKLRRAWPARVGGRNRIGSWAASRVWLATGRRGGVRSRGVSAAGYRYSVIVDYGDGYLRPTGMHTVVRMRHDVDSGRTRRTGSADLLPPPRRAAFPPWWCCSRWAGCWVLRFSSGRCSRWAWRAGRSAQQPRPTKRRTGDPGAPAYVCGWPGSVPSVPPWSPWWPTSAGRVRTSVVYLVLAMVLVVPSYRIAGPAYRTLNPPRPPPPAPTHCMEHSGGDTKCPGGKACVRLRPQPRLGLEQAGHISRWLRGHCRGVLMISATS